MSSGSQPAAPLRRVAQRARRLFRQPEVEQLDAVLGDQDVGGREVPVRDALLVRGIECAQNLCRVFDGLLDGQPAAGVGVDVSFGDPPRRSSVSAGTNSQGQYALEGLPPGTYYLSTSSVDGLQDEIFGGGPCISPCPSALAVCDWRDRGSPPGLAGGPDATGVACGAGTPW